MTEIKMAAHRTQMNRNHDIAIKDYFVAYFDCIMDVAELLQWGSKVFLRDIHFACEPQNNDVIKICNGQIFDFYETVTKTC